MPLFRGTQRPDVITASGADDEVRAGNGADLVFGGAGNDLLLGENDNDVLFGGEGSDRLFGDNGNDALSGGEGADTLFGGRGDDTVTGGAGADLIVFGRGHDTVTDFQPNRTVTIGFEGIAPAGTIVNIDASYAGLEWPIYQPNAGGFPLFDFFGVAAAGTTFASGYAYNFSSAVGRSEAFAPDRRDLLIESSEGRFDLVSADFAAKLDAAYYDVQLTIEGLRDGAVVATEVEILREGTPLGLADPLLASLNTVSFSAAYSDLDAVRLRTRLINPEDGSVWTGGGLLSPDFVIDNIVLGYDEDRIGVTSAAQASQLLASAVSDGQGGTLLTDGDNMMTLAGVDPSRVSADWFTVVA